MNFFWIIGFSLFIIACNPAPAKYTEEDLGMKAYHASESGDYQSSVNYYNQLIKLDSLNGSYYFGRADSYAMLAKRNEEIRDYMKSLQLNFRKGSCYFNIALAYTFINDSLALVYFKEAMKLYPQRIDIKREYDECLERLKTNPSH